MADNYEYSTMEILLEIKDLTNWKGSDSRGILKNKMNAIGSRAKILIEREREARAQAAAQAAPEGGATSQPLPY